MTETKGLTSWSCSCRNSCRGRIWSKKMESFSFSKFLRSTLRLVSWVLVAWLSGLKKRERERKREWIYFLLNSPTFCSPLIVPGQKRAFPSPFYPNLLLVLVAPPTVTHSFVCLFFHLQHLPPPKSWSASEITITYFISNAFRKACELFLFTYNNV